MSCTESLWHVLAATCGDDAQFGAKNREDGVEWEVKEVLKYYETDMGFMSK